MKTSKVKKQREEGSGGSQAGKEGGVKSMDEGEGSNNMQYSELHLHHPPAISSQTLGVVLCALGTAGSSSFAHCDESRLETVFH